MRLGITTAWLTLSSRAEYLETWLRTSAAFSADPAWEAWFAQHSRFPDELHTLIVDDVEVGDLRMRKRGKEVSLTVPAAEVEAAWQEGRLEQEMSTYIRSIYSAWAERHDVEQPPPSPRAGHPG